MRTISSLCVLLCLTVSGFAQDVASGPDAGTNIPALKVKVKSGDFVDKTLDIAAKRKADPTFYVFIPKDKRSRPMHRFLIELSKTTQKNIKKGQLVVVWLTDDAKATDAYLAKIANNYYQNYPITNFAYFPGAKTGPEKWTINDQADITITVAKNGKVAASLGYNSVNATVVREVMAAYKKKK